ncbi:MAG: amidohydrolase [Myxococcota bacterium]
MRGLLVLCAGLALACGGSPGGKTMYRGGSIVTLDPENRVVEALGVEGDRIGAVGSEEAVRAWAGDGARVVELGGHALLPGFIDAHGHYPGAGVYAYAADLNSPPIGSIQSIDDLVAAIRARAADRDAGDWVIGMSYDDTLLREGRHPTRADLDRVSTEHPVGAVHISGHLAAVNSRGLEALRIARDTKDPPGGRIRRDAAGEPTGVLEETAMEPVMADVMRPGLFGSLAIVEEANRRYLAAGVTTAQVGYATEGLLNLVWLSRLGLVPLRLVIWPGAELMDAVLSGEASLPASDPLWVRFGAVKLIADGSIQGYTAYLREPYFVPPGDDPGARGYPRYPKDELLARVASYRAAGQQVAIHGNGDAAIDDILDALEAAQLGDPQLDARPVIVHAQMMQPDQLDRVKRLRAIPSFFVLHTYYWGDRHRERFLGPERAARISPARTAQQKDVRFTLHCDTPVVPVEPLRLVWAAVNRRTTSGQELGADERIDVTSALRAITIDAAFQHFEEDQKGSLEPGKLADLVILGRSPLAENPDDLDAIPVLETIVGGRSVYRAAE